MVKINKDSKIMILQEDNGLYNRINSFNSEFVILQINLSYGNFYIIEFIEKSLYSKNWELSNYDISN